MVDGSATVDVEEPVRPGTRSPKHVYPREFRGTRIGGAVHLSFLVDSTGRVVPSSVRLIGWVHPVLANAARDVVLSSRYRPARIRGRPVTQLVQQQLTYLP